MNAVVQPSHPYLAEFERVETTLVGSALPWLHALRREAIAAFCARGFPGVQDEDWKYTRTAPIERRAFKLAPASAAVEADRVRQVLHAEFAGHALVFVDGRYRADWSRIDGLARGVRVQSLAAALNEDAPGLRAAFSNTAELQRHPFALLNTAIADGGAYIVLEKNAALEQPLQLVFIATAAQDGHMTHPRIVIEAGDHSRALLIERFVALDETQYFTNVLTTVNLGNNAAVEYCRVQEESVKAFHISGVHVHQERDSRFLSQAVSLGGLLTRNDINVQLAAPGVECTLNGLYMASGRQHVDTHTRVDHLQPHGTSHEFYKGVLDGFGRGVFNGKLVVHPDAQKTDARQGNHNLLLSDNAEADSKPELEIYADDVKCAHGATVGQLNADAVFYLRSRGMDEQSARSLLTYAFAAEIIERLELPTLRGYVQRALTARLPGGQQIKEFI